MDIYIFWVYINSSKQVYALRRMTGYIEYVKVKILQLVYIKHQF